MEAFKGVKVYCLTFLLLSVSHYFWQRRREKSKRFRTVLSCSNSRVSVQHSNKTGWNAQAFTSEESGHHRDICQKQIKNINNKTEGSG